jgi:hypothetical protein
MQNGNDRGSGMGSRTGSGRPGAACDGTVDSGHLIPLRNGLLAAEGDAPPSPF